MCPSNTKPYCRLQFRSEDCTTSEAICFKKHFFKFKNFKRRFFYLEIKNVKEVKIVKARDYWRFLVAYQHEMSCLEMDEQGFLRNGQIERFGSRLFDSSSYDQLTFTLVRKLHLLFPYYLFSTQKAQFYSLFFGQLFSFTNKFP